MTNNAGVRVALDGMHAAADFIDAKAEKYLQDHADTEQCTGATVFHYGEPGRDYHSMLTELAEELRAQTDRRRCKSCNATRGGTHCWKCGTETFTPDPRCGDDPALPPLDRIRELAKEVGYAIGLHGSQQRDLDVIAAPWSEDAVGNHALLEHIAAGLVSDNGPARIIEIERKPLGRYAATIQMDGWYKNLDISICPFAVLPLQAPAQEKAQ